MPARYRLFTFITAVVLVLDQATKLYVDRTFALYESVPVIDNFFALTYVRNKGAAFGILADSAYRIPFFVAIASIAVTGIVWYLHKTRADQRLLHLALSLIFSGAIGNLIDRIRLGEVIDFLDVHWYQAHWPAFNVADSAITVGVGLMLFDMWREGRRQQN